ncbi:hypothetical protein PFTANZ_06438 [Plasmodium falciparum Tanzania (2000708)]|uniref:GOLD domain-containing protein n=1 Tax=Plasmodium falciparum Tanzania (2000708) TaxID=1036725 RepID=A0A024VWN2_PLAFA|nr:hypothetical protein PFTANZ_06438 [Plasmodium falciparum Tanzania (2000708)]
MFIIYNSLKIFVCEKNYIQKKVVFFLFRNIKLISYLSTKDGLYHICISCPSTNWFKSTAIKWSLSIEVGGSDIDPENLAKKSELSETLTILNNLKKKFNSMKLQQIYQKQMVQKNK